MEEKIIRYGNRGTCRLNFDKENKEMAYFTFSGLERTGIVEHFFSTRYGGVSSDYLYSLNFSYSQETVQKMWMKISEGCSASAYDEQ